MTTMKKVFCSAAIFVVLAFMSPAALFAGGRTEIPAPEITTDLNPITYVSPGQADTIQDSVRFVVSILPAKRMVIKSYSFQLIGPDGTAVYTQEGQVEEEESFFGRMFIAVGFVGLKSPVDVPDFFEWTGTDDAGDLVPDGTYTLRISGVDDKGNEGIGETYEIIVDNTLPSMVLNLPYLVFSPNDDGNQDILIIEHAGSAEESWTGALTDETGAIIRSYSWQNEAPGNITWDGTDTDGDGVPDGSYSYSVTGADLAGNTATVESPAISVDTRDTPISLTREPGNFSPNSDGVLDTISFSPEIPVTEGIKEWQLDVLSQDSVTVRVYTGSAEPPDQIVFDGKDDQGATLPEGSYSGSISVLYTNGNNPDASAPEFVLDLTPPSVSLQRDLPVFSPNGDGNKDALTIYQLGSLEDMWTGVIADADGNAARSYTWRGAPEEKIVWDGRDESGDVAANGSYIYTLSVRDRAGNYSEAATRPFIVDVRETPIEIAVDGSAFSPNRDGSIDTIALRPGVTDPEGIAAMRIRVLDRDGQAIRSFAFDEAVDTVTWDGFGETARAVPDGEYSVELTVVYENGNTPTAKAGPIIVDTVFPSVEVSVANPFFSPDGDGKRDYLPINQTGATEEVLWTSAILDADQSPVRSFVWPRTVQSFAWDGSDEDGNVLSDGTYSYRIESTDQAGNRFQHTVPGITLDTRKTPVSLRISGSSFSPNGDGVIDTIVITPQFEVSENITGWELSIINDADTAVLEFAGSNAPDATEFDGKGDSGSVLPEGEYRAELSILYRNGSNPSTRSGAFNLDVTAPIATLSAAETVFSPNGDGKKDRLAVAQTGSTEIEWVGRIADAKGDEVRTLSWFGTPDEDFAWDGKNDNGRMVSDGVFYYTISATDRAGTVGTSNEIVFEKDTRDTPLALLADHSSFSPNGDGVKDQIAIRPQIGQTDRIESYRFYVTRGSATGVAVFERAGDGSPPSQISWTGVDRTGARVADGTYAARLELTYGHGNQPSAATPVFAVDTKAPTVSVSSGYTLFSPDGDDRRDLLPVIQESSEEGLWEGIFYPTDSSKPARSFFWKGRAVDFAWDARDNDGNTVPDGSYRYEIRATDAAGNTAAAALNGILVDTRTVSAFVNPAAAAFSPNGDGVKDSLTLNLYKSLAEGISSWQLTILNASRRSVRTFTGSRATPIPSSIIWNGKSDSGTIVDGQYSAELRIEYDKGNVALATTESPFLLDATGPTFATRITPVPFSPDDDGVDDTVSFAFANVADASSIASWKIEIQDPYERSFFAFAGAGAPGSARRWNGKSVSGELVQAAEDYHATFTLVDSLGNRTVKDVIVPVDILVFRDGDRLKIRISSIQFAPNSADFLNFDEEKAERNLKTLKRLAVILEKYSAYQIRIEGHAVSVYWNNPERAKVEERDELQPLSLARAEEVKSVLMDLGITGSRMTAVGMGGTQPVVPHGDLENRWKSRRVEFILIR